MELEYANPKHSSRRRHLWLQLTLLIAFIFCLILGVGALAALFILRTDQETTPVISPLYTLPVENIAPQHALAQLAGDPANALAFQAIQAGELDLAHTIVFFSTELNDHERLVIWQQLGRRYIAADRIEDGIQAYNNARTIVVLSPNLSFLDRTQALLQMVDDFLKVDATAEALDAAIQAKRIAEQTPDMLPAQRSQVFESLRQFSRRLDNSTFEQEIEAAIRNPYITPPGTAVILQWTTLDEDLATDPAVAEAITLRQQAARTLADRIAFTSGVDTEPERQTLATALIQEDQARNAAFQRLLASGISLGQQLTLLQEHRHWAALKLHIAARGFGYSIIPEWEANIATLQQELAGANNNLFIVIEALTTTKTDPIPQVMLRAETQLWVAQQTQLGLVTDRTLANLSQQMRLIQDQLTQLGMPLALPVANQEDASPPGFRIFPINALP